MTSTYATLLLQTGPKPAAKPKSRGKDGGEGQQAAVAAASSILQAGTKKDAATKRPAQAGEGSEATSVKIMIRRPKDYYLQVHM